MLQLPTVEQSTSRASVCLPAGSVKKKATRTSANFETMFEWLYDEKMKESTRRLRLIRRARRNDSGAAGVFDDAIAAMKQSHCADRKLEEKKAKLPDNQKIDYPQVDIIDGLSSSSFPLDSDRYFSQVLTEAKKARNFERASYLLDRRNQKLTNLKRYHQLVYEDQKQSGLWQLRVEAAAAANVANRLTYEASETKLRTAADCAAAAKFLGVLCQDIRHRDNLNAFVVGRLSKRLVECLGSLEGRAQ